MFCSGQQGTKIICSYEACSKIYHMGCSIEKVHYDLANKISYCQDHDPSKRKNVFTSNSIVKDNYSGYIKLTDRPVIRQKIKMSDWIETDYIKIIRSDPVIFRDQISSIDDKLFNIISRYWKCKRSVDRNYGIFYLRHTFNNKNMYNV